MNTTTEPARPQLVDKAGWRQLAVHEIQLPSGAWVKIRIPDLALLLAGDAVPERLRVVALSQVMDEIRGFSDDDNTGGAESAVEERDEEAEAAKHLEALKRLAELHRWIVSQMLVEPRLTPDELADVVNGPPEDDVLLLTAIATRERATDARGVTIGVEPLSRYAGFREVHGCAPDCAACEALRQRFSTARTSGL